MSAPSFDALISAAVPGLRRYAVSLTRNTSDAEDLVQDTLLRAWRHRRQFEPGTNFGAWTTTILRRVFLDERRRGSNRIVATLREMPSTVPAAPGQQESRHQIRDLRRALARLTRDHREALITCGLLGHGYEDAADIIGVPVGTVRSRLSRARAEVRRHMDGERPPRFRRVSHP